MADHDFVYAGEDAVNHNFVCSKCGRPLDFNKPGIGEPNADLSEATPKVPPDYAQYVPPCEA